MLSMEELIEARGTTKCEDCNILEIINTAIYMFEERNMLHKELNKMNRRIVDALENHRKPRKRR